MTPFEPSGKQSGSALPSRPSPKKLSIGEITLNGLPVITEVVSGADNPLTSVMGEEEAQQLLHKLEAHLETLFTQKLGLRLEQLQRVAIDQALDELKAELPELLREALNEYLEAL